MRGKTFAAALFALAARASAQAPVAVAPDVQQSVLLVLATAIPSEVASYALASSSAFAEEMASSLAAGKTPAWYQALPTDVLSLLPQIYPFEAEATPTPSSASMYATPAPSSAAVTSSASMSASAPVASASSAMTHVISVNSTSRAVQSPTLSASTTAATFTGAASFPTAAVGASLGAVLGFFGMLAL
ncbi:hypothetical protein IAQ61_005928 [Plenodomus lingam]|uniref:Predicted protein n=1 Tax=Leptosphaeria maculans (strain JN3 / isolate v23.1.3 / race Av1-4-5-6-7-8) TaxID=985895 RepID=E4ZLM0_LEPMJ|nr:predicted protein [Plenodomus lingam JN3]KAH9870453.1 hypothetical protein IAQ61_005928 [Plenodomus lingam]CBX92700.1 predicted protein [Plenodomus lingam JN3]